MSGLYVKLYTDFPMREAVAEAGYMAELLYYRGSMFTKDRLTDGRITRTQLIRFVAPDLPDVEAAADRLVEVGLWKRSRAGYEIVGWLDENPSAEEVAEHRAAQSKGGKEGNHNRWHKKDGPFATCKKCNPSVVPISEPIAPPIATESLTDRGDRSLTESVPSRYRSPETETETETDPEAKPENRSSIDSPASPALIDLPSDSHASFAEWWSLYPRKVAKTEAQKAWAKLKPPERSAALAALPAHVQLWEQEGRGTTTTPHPSTWLNGRRWEDEIRFEPGRAPPALPRPSAVMQGIELRRQIRDRKQRKEIEDGS